MLTYLDEAAVRAALKWDPLIDAMQAALAAFSSRRAIQPVRTTLTIEEGKRYLGIMPAVAGDTMGVKAVSFFPRNAASGLPTHLAVILLMRADTGEPLAALDGRLITEMRTAAVSAAATRLLAAPESRVLALIGSGVQAEAHLRALARVRPFADIRVWSRNPEHARKFVETHAVRAEADVEAAVRGADVVVTATSSQTPVLRGAWLKPGAHVNAIGAARPTWRELDDAAMNAGALIVDSRDAARVESGDVIGSGAPIAAELGELFSGAKSPPAAGTTTIFKSLGLAVEDIAAAKLALDSSRR